MPRLIFKFLAGERERWALYVWCNIGSWYAPCFLSAPLSIISSMCSLQPMYDELSAVQRGPQKRTIRTTWVQCGPSKKINQISLYFLRKSPTKSDSTQKDGNHIWPLYLSRTHMKGRANLIGEKKRKQSRLIAIWPQSNLPLVFPLIEAKNARWLMPGKHNIRSREEHWLNEYAFFPLFFLHARMPKDISLIDGRGRRSTCLVYSVFHN